MVTTGAVDCFAVTVGDSILRQRSTWAWLDESPPLVTDLVGFGLAIVLRPISADLVLVLAADSKGLDEDRLSRSGLAW
jgi:hypothetical protein